MFFFFFAGRILYRCVYMQIYMFLGFGGGGFWSGPVADMVVLMGFSSVGGREGGRQWGCVGTTSADASAEGAAEM